MKPLVHAVIHGGYTSMKNGRIPAGGPGGLRFIKSRRALNWEGLALCQVKRSDLPPYEGPVALVADFHYEYSTSDLDENLLKDMVQLKKKLKPCLAYIKDDVQVVVHNCRKFVDRERPRVEFALWRLEDYEAMCKKADDYIRAQAWV